MNAKIAIVAVILGALCVSAASVALTSATFDEAINDQSKNVFVKFYAPWCGHCQRLAPTWDELADAYAGDDSVVIAKVNLEENRDVADAQGIQGLPTLKLFKKGADKSPVEYNGGRDLGSLKGWLDGKKE